jgi:triosephosphate isomerase
MSQRRTIIAGNWKMNTDLAAARSLAAEVARGVSARQEVEVLLFPPAPFLAQVVEAVRGSAVAIGVGAQDIYFEPQGAFTGEVSAAMVLSTGARWTLVGHSERRQIFGEDDALLRRKVGAALTAGLSPVLCVGETLAEREAGSTEKIVLGQLRAGLVGLDADAVARVVIAYEPVWAIGTGVTATPEQGSAVHRAIRNELAELASPDVAKRHPILYGGSVSPANVKELLSEPDIDGALVGGASLDGAKFLAVCNWKR